MNNDELWLYTLAKKNGIIITDIQLNQLSSYKEHLLEWNAKINLISRKNEERIWKGHIVLSLTMLFVVKFQMPSRILDLGTGGGLPGIPLSILLPGCSFLLLDSTKKKIAAVQDMVDTLKLPNVRTLWGRAEEVNKQKGFALSYDYVVARSVSDLSNLLEWGSPFLTLKRGKTGSEGEKTAPIPSVLTFKGGDIKEEELSAKSRYRKYSISSIPLVFPGSEEFEGLEKKIVIATRHG